MKTKSRKVKAEEYESKYSNVPKDKDERLNQLFEECKYTEKKMDRLNKTIYDMEERLTFESMTIVLYEEPEGSPRPRFRLINRKNLSNMAINNGSFVHVYSPVASGDNKYMKRLTDSEIIQMDQLIYTPCKVVIDAYLRIPSAFSQQDKALSEMGYIRPITKPDWDNIGKKYSDMFNDNIWYDDAYVISGTVNKWYSTLPRVEIRIEYLNMLYNKYQYNNVSKKMGPDDKLEFYKLED